MGLREKLQGNPVVFGLVAILVVAGSIFVIARMRGPSIAPPKQVYYFDLGTSKLFAGDAAAQPPIDAGSGPGKGVKAAVFGCGDCSEANRKIVFLTTMTPEARAATDKLANGGPEATHDIKLQLAIDKGTLVAETTVGGAEPKWYSVTTTEGIAIQGRAISICGQKSGKTCYPGS